MHCLLGNHETMNMSHDFRFVTPEDVATYGNLDNRIKEWSKEGTLGKWLREKKIVHKAGDAVFVHAGYSLLSKYHQARSKSFIVSLSLSWTPSTT